MKLTPRAGLLLIGLLLAALTGCRNVESEAKPLAAKTPTARKAIAAGLDHTIATRTDGTVWTWGNNSYGKLGTGQDQVALGSTSAPQQVCEQYNFTMSACTRYLANVTAVAAGDDFNLALKTDGSVWAWGENWSGSLGRGAFDGLNHPLPSPVCAIWDPLTSVCMMPLTGVAAIATGNWHALALKTDGSVWAWGSNSDGKLGDGTLTDRPLPVRVCASFDGATQKCLAYPLGIKALGGGGWYHSVLLRNDGTVWSMGYNGWGTLGNATFTSSAVPVQACEVYDYTGLICQQPLTGVVRVHGGEYDSVALKQDGTLWAWGFNNYGEASGLGDWTTYSLPVQEPLQASDWITASIGTYHTIALRVGGSAWGWGANYNGQLGMGASDPANNTLRHTCAPFYAAPCSVFISGLVDIATEGNHNVALRSNGAIYTWGNDGTGQLGQGFNSGFTTWPVQEVTGTTNWGIHLP